MAAFREEIFGPVAPVIVVKDAHDAVSVANDTDYGLVAAIQTGSLERGFEVASQLRTGIVHVNDQTLNNDAFAPLGQEPFLRIGTIGAYPRALPGRPQR